jgi:hypothetical protein
MPNYSFVHKLHSATVKNENNALYPVMDNIFFKFIVSNLSLTQFVPQDKHLIEYILLFAFLYIQNTRQLSLFIYVYRIVFEVRRIFSIILIYSQDM